MFERGFKTKAEKLSENYRKELGIHVCGILPAQKLAKHISVGIITLEDLDLDEKIKLKLLKADSGWSAVVLDNIDNKKLIVHNHKHNSGRQQSNLMHELAHVICEHKANESPNSKFSFMRSYDKKHEDEAGYLGAALQISRPGLLWAFKRKMSHSEIATHFNASEEMVRFRVNASGVGRQVAYKNR
jgi:Zn-dependent peptidase ImmA (M78 family)